MWAAIELFVVHLNYGEQSIVKSLAFIVHVIL